MAQLLSDDPMNQIGLGLVSVGAINWGTSALFDLDLVAELAKLTFESLDPILKTGVALFGAMYFWMVLGSLD